LIMGAAIFNTHADCIKYLERVRWQGKPTCPYCNVQKSTPMKDGRHHCNGCGLAYSVTVKTIFHRSHLPLDKWFLAIRLIIVSHGKISVRELAKSVQINRNTACQLINKVSNAMVRTDDRQFLLGIVEMQE
jgi:transposase-like protein